MTASRSDRWVVLALAGVQVLAVSSLVILWCWALDGSACSTLLVLAGVLLACSMAVLLPSVLIRHAQRALIWFGDRDVLSVLRAQTAPAGITAGEARAVNRIMGASALLAAVGGACSTAAILPARWLVDWLGRSFLWSPAGWGVCRLFVAFLGMLPLAMGTAVTFLASTLLRGGSGRDRYAAVCRDWLWAAAIGVGAFGGACAAGANLLGVVAACHAAMAAGAVGLFARQGVAMRPRRLIRPAPVFPNGVHRWAIIGCFAALSSGLLVQLRLLADAGGLGMPVRMAWLGGSLALLAWFFRRTDRKSRPPGRAQQIGAAMGALTGLAVQSVLILAAANFAGETGHPASIVLAALAASLQVPIASLAVVVLSRQRRLFAEGGGRVRAYAAAATGGAAIGVVGYLFVLSVPAGHAIFVGVLLATIAAWVLVGVGMGGRPQVQLRWMAYGGALICATAAAFLAILGQLRASGLAIDAGPWLTTVVARDDSSGRWVRVGCLPFSKVGPGEALSRLLAEEVADGQRRWWVAAASERDLPPGLRGKVISLRSPPAAAGGPATIRAFELGGAACGGLFEALPIGHEKFDGLLLAPPPVDHPQAWRFYNASTLRRCRQVLTSGAKVLLRTQAPEGYFAAALSVIKTFHHVFGPGRAWIELRGGRMDLLVIVGRSSQEPSVPKQADLYCLPTDRFVSGWPSIPIIRLETPWVFRRRPRPTLLWLRYRLGRDCEGPGGSVAR